MKNYRTVYDLDVHAFDKPEYHWNFYDAYNNSTEVKLAAKNNEVSIYPANNLEKYLKLSKQIHQNEDNKRLKEIHGSLPNILEDLLSLQTKLGNWDDMPKVLNVLSLPASFDFDLGLSNWEKATAIALAVIRQHSEYFSLLCESHDRALTFIKDHRIISKARDALIQYQVHDVIVVDSIDKNIETIIQNQMENNLDNEEDDDYIPINIPSDIESLSIDWIPDPAVNSDDPLNEDELPVNIDIKAGNKLNKRLTRLVIDNIHNKRNQPKPPTPNILYYDLPDRLPKETLTNTARAPIKWISSPINTSNRLNTSRELRVPIDKVNSEIDKCEKRIESIQMNIISLYGDIESLANEIFKCNERSVLAYSKCLTNNERNFQFNELLARLGDGCESDPKSGISWRYQGVPGIRPKLLKFYGYIQDMAEERLLRDEWKTINQLDELNRKREQQVDKELSKDRWRFIWNNEDIVYRTIHILDRLRTCKELSLWLGRNFYLLANPLMLSFNNMIAYTTLNMKDKVDEQIYSIPHARMGIGRDVNNQMFKYYLNTWREKFQDLCDKTKSFQVPSPPLVKSDSDNLSVYTAMLVIFVSMGDDLNRIHEYEQRFITLSETIRGQHLLKGTNINSKPKKVLDLSFLNLIDSKSTEDTNLVNKVNNDKPIKRNKIILPRIIKSPRHKPVQQVNKDDNENKSNNNTSVTKLTIRVDSPVELPNSSPSILTPQVISLFNQSSRKVKKSLNSSTTASKPTDYNQRVGFIKTLENIQKEEKLMKEKQNKDQSFNHLLQNTKSSSQGIKPSVEAIELNEKKSNKKFKHKKAVKKKMKILLDGEIVKHSVSRDKISSVNALKLTRRVDSISINNNNITSNSDD